MIRRGPRKNSHPCRLASHPRQLASQRGGLVLITVLVCLVIVCGVATSALQVSVLAARQTRVDERAAQAEWLAEAGLEWARERLEADSAWTGATWRVSAEPWGQAGMGEVVATLAGDGEAKVLRVSARYPIAKEPNPALPAPITARLERSLTLPSDPPRKDQNSESNADVLRTIPGASRTNS